MDIGLAFVIVITAIAVSAMVIAINLFLAPPSSGASRLAGLRTLNEDTMDAGLVDRVLLPSMQRLGRFGMRLTPQAWASRTRGRLVRAGFYPDIDETSWAAIRVMAIFGAVVVYLMLFGRLDGIALSLLLLVLLIGGFAGPDQILNRRIAQRVHAIERDLPDLIDLLVISIEAGLGFEASLDRVVAHVPGELSDEFARMLQETRVGVSRQNAMRALAERTDVDDLNSFILAMNQADTYGVSIGRMLRVQADEMRVRRRQRVQEKAFGAPVKMVFPLVLCVFPAIFVILLGPAAISIVRNLTTGS